MPRHFAMTQWMGPECSFSYERVLGPAILCRVAEGLVLISSNHCSRVNPGQDTSPCMTSIKKNYSTLIVLLILVQIWATFLRQSTTGVNAVISPHRMIDYVAEQSNLCGPPVDFSSLWNAVLLAWLWPSCSSSQSPAPWSFPPFFMWHFNLEPQTFQFSSHHLCVDICSNFATKLFHSVPSLCLSFLCIYIQSLLYHSWNARL